MCVKMCVCVCVFRSNGYQPIACHAISAQKRWRSSRNSRRWASTPSTSVAKVATINFFKCVCVCVCACVGVCVRVCDAYLLNPHTLHATP